MKKYLLTIGLFMAIIPFSYLYGQKNLISTNLSFNTSEKDNDPYYGSGTEKVKVILPSLRYGRTITDYLLVGAGLSYKLDNRIFESRFYPYYSASGYYASPNYSEGELTETTISPHVFVEGFYNISNKLMLSMNLQFHYAFLKSHTRNSYTAILYNDPSLPGSYIINENEFETNKEQFKMNLQPVIRYLIFDKLGAELMLGGLAYSKILSHDNPNAPVNAMKDKELDFDLNPKNWQFGIFYTF